MTNYGLLYKNISRKRVIRQFPGRQGIILTRKNRNLFFEKKQVCGHRGLQTHFFFERVKTHFFIDFVWLG